MQIRAKRSSIVSILMIAALIVAGASPVAAGTGDLDTVFGTNGRVVSQVDAEADEEPMAVAVQPDGKIVVVVWDHTTTSGILVLRFTRDGALDPSFSDDGRLRLEADGTDATQGEEPVDLALLPDGDLLVAGHGSVGGEGYTWIVFRVDPGGTLDEDFGTGGRATRSDVGASSSPQPMAMAVQPDGKIVLAGYGAILAGQDPAFVRFLATGGVDDDFGTSGVALFDAGQNATVNEVAVAGSNIYAVGSVFTSPATPMLVRLISDGTPDDTFDDDGMVLDDWGNASYEQSLLPQPDGKVLMAGQRGANVAVARYLSTGERDPNFGTGGLASHRFIVSTEGGDEPKALALHSSGKILVAGNAYISTNYRMGLMRLTPAGALDTSFSDDGRMFVEFPGVDAQASDLALQGKGVILAGPVTNDATSKDQAGLARVEGREASRTTVGVSKTRRKVIASGGVKPNHSGSRVTVTLFKRKGGKFVKVASKRATLTSRSKYRAAFGRGKPGRCRLVTKFAGDSDHLASSARRNFRC
jgi:uncharacterized delta-60 repeat protein